MSKDDKKMMQLLRDLGEVNEKFIDEADTQVVQRVKGRNISWTSVCGIAAAAVIFLTVGISVFRKINENPVKPAVTSEISVQTTTVTSETDDQKKNEEEKSEETKASTESTSAVSQDEEKKTESDVIINQSPYPYPEDIKTRGASAMKNSDGSIRVSFENGKFALTFPSALENHFVINEGKLLAKNAYEKGHDSEATSFIFSTDTADYLSHGFDRLLGYSDNTFFIAVRNTDYQEMDDDAAKEYDLICENLSTIYASSESYSDTKGKMDKVFPVPADFKGEVRDNYASPLFGYTDDYVLYGGSEANAGKWPLEDGWHITAKRAVSTNTGTWFDCYDTDDNDHYGWINAEIVYFYFMDENK